MTFHKAPLSLKHAHAGISSAVDGGGSKALLTPACRSHLLLQHACLRRRKPASAVGLAADAHRWCP